MKTQKGIVFEITSSYSIFLTEDGRFQKGIPLPSSVLVGEEVSFRPYVAKPKMKSSVKSAWMAPLVAAVAIVLMFFSVLLPAQAKVSAFVQVDFNPSIELGIDENGDVQQFRGLNEDGTSLKREISFWKGKSLTTVLTTIVDRSPLITQNENQIEITTIYKEKSSHDSLEKLIRTAVEESTSRLETKPIQVNEATIEDRANANEKGVSVDAYKQNKLQEKEKMKKQEPLPKVKGNSKKEEKEHNKNQNQTEEKIKKEQKNEQKMKEKLKNNLEKNANKYSWKQQEAKNSGIKGKVKEKSREKGKNRKNNKDKSETNDRNKVNKNN